MGNIIDRIQVGLCRSRRNGIYLTVKSEASVEATIKGMGSGDVESVDVFGKSWSPMKDCHPLQVWNFGTLLKTQGFRLDRPGLPLDLEKGELNLSFVRLVGISQPEGVRFKLAQPLSYSEMKKFQAQIQDGIGRIYVEYMKPVKLSVIVSTQETLE